MGTLMLKASSNNDHLEISHAVLEVNDKFYEKVLARKAIFDAAVAADKANDLFSMSFSDCTADFFENDGGSDDVPTYKDPMIVLTENPRDFMGDDNLMNVKAMCMVLTQYGFYFEGFEKYSGVTVNTDTVAFTDLPLKTSK